MEYKEVHRKNGEILVFCRLEELLKESYEVSTMEEVEANANSSGEYICTCPFCKSAHDQYYNKKKLYVKTDLTVGHCFVCTRNFVGINDDINCNFKVPEFSQYSLAPDKFEIVKLTDPNFSLEKFKYEFDDYDEAGVKYLEGRQPFMAELWKILGFKFWDHNVAIPFYFKGEQVYYQIRFTSKTNKIRYYFPPISAKPIYYIPREGTTKVIICEGVFDAIALMIQAPEYTPIAVLGSSVSDYQLDMIKEIMIPSKILVYMDKTELSKNIANRLKQVMSCEVGIIKSDGEDPEENLVKRSRWGYKYLQWIK